MISTAKTVIAIGLAGEGKSTLLNRLAGKELFTEYDDPTAGTKDTELKNGNFSGLAVQYIDTPGLDDQEGIDAEHIQAMVNKIKANGKLNALLIVFNATSSRFTQSLKRIVKLYFKMFNTPDIWDHICLVFTKCYPSVRKILETDLKKSSYVGLVKDIYKECFSVDPVTKPLCYFVDSKVTDDAQNNGVLTLLNGFIANCGEISCKDMKKADPVYSKIEYQTISEVIKTEDVPCGTQQIQVGTREVSRGGIEGFFGGTRDVPVYSTKTLYKKVDTWVDKQRQVKTMYDGKSVAYGDWEILKTYKKDQ